jgi:uncharacterized membrane protein YhaH (DUF805 family)
VLVRFFSIRARAGQLRWLAWFALSLGILCGWAALLLVFDVEGLALIAAYAVPGLAVAKLATESVRRLHDCGQRAGFGLAATIGVIMLFLFGCGYWMGYGATPVFWGIQVGVAASIAALFLRPGTRDANGYGPPPGRLGVSGPKSGAAGLWIATALLAANLWLGWWVVEWQAAMQRQAEWRSRMPDPDADPEAYEAWRNADADS